MGFDANRIALDEARAALEADGPLGVVRLLNGLTDHRFTALFKFEGEALHSSYFFDREQPDVTLSADMPIMASYCVFVRSGRNTFVTEDSVGDERVLHHPKRLEVRSYCGVPLVDASGRMFGTICHFDPDAKPISNDNVTLMEDVARLLSGADGSAP